MLDLKRIERIEARVAALLREKRLAKRLSMNALAERAGLSQQMVSYIERGMRGASLATLFRLTSALEIPLSEVISAAEKRG